MAKRQSKKFKERSSLVDDSKNYTIEEAIATIKKLPAAKFDETITLNFQLGIRPDSGSENVRGAVGLPHGSGKSVRVLCFAKGAAAKEAQENGADEVGSDELVKKIQGGWFEFDAVVAHPDMMREVSKLGRVLGPKGLMPTPKTGGVTPNVGKAVKELKAGKIEFKSDKTAGLHAVCGKMSFSEGNLAENAHAVVKAILDAKPVTSKGEYFKSLSMASTFGPGLHIELSSL